MELTRETLSRVKQELVNELEEHDMDEDTVNLVTTSLGCAVANVMLGDSSPQRKPKTRGGRPKGAKNKPKPSESDSFEEP